MSAYTWNETFEQRLVTYIQEVDGRLIVIEHVPARICIETGEQLFSPETVNRIQAIIRTKHRPKRVIETPVYEFAEANARKE